MKIRAGRLAAPLAVVAAGIVASSGACTDALTAPGAVAALDFTGIAFPAVITGDTLRDGDGVATPLSAIVYNGRGDVVVGAAVQYLTVDTGVTIDANGYLVATRRDGAVRVFASVAGLQSQLRSIQVTRAPDTVVAPTTAVALDYVIPDASSNVSPALTFTLQSSDTAGGVSPNVAGWRVRWRVIHNGDTLAPTDTSNVALWPGGGTRHALTDTTSSAGVSTRRLRVYANTLPVQQDSFIVVAEVRSRGAQVPGSPVRFVVTINPPTIPPPSANILP